MSARRLQPLDDPQHRRSIRLKACGPTRQVAASGHPQDTERECPILQPDGIALEPLVADKSLDARLGSSAIDQKSIAIAILKPSGDFEAGLLVHGGRAAGL